MKKLTVAFAVGLLLLLSGCVTERTVIRQPPARGVYVRPAYPAPGPGYYWRLNPRHGWGWYHGKRGWYRGWR